MLAWGRGEGQSNNYLSTVFVEENNVAPVVGSKADLRSEIQVKYMVYFFHILREETDEIKQMNKLICM